MRSAIGWIVAVAILGAIVGPAAVAAPNQPSFEIRRPTVIAFFPPVTEKDLDDDPDTNEALSDFQFYAAQVREPLRKAGVDFHEAYAHSFRIRLGNKTVAFRPGKVDVGYYFIASGKKPRVEYGVMTSDDILQVAHQYFGIPLTNSSSH
jgi:hypothetical protein